MIFFSLFIFSLYVVPIHEIHIFIVSLLLLLLHTCISVMTILAPDFSIPSSTFDDELSLMRVLHSKLECGIIFKEWKTNRRYQNLHPRLPPRTHNILATHDLDRQPNSVWNLFHNSAVIWLSCVCLEFGI